MKEVGLVLLIGLFQVGLLFLGAGYLETAMGRGTPSLLLPLLLILGVTLLVSALAAYAVILHGFGLSKEGAYALGLPEGSVRAVLALALVLVFAIMSVFLFDQLERPTGRLSTGLTAEQVGLLAPGRVLTLQPEPSTDPQTFSVTLSSADPAASQLAQQLVTVLATLVTAVAAFYFGASSVKEAGATTVKLLTGQASRVPDTGRRLPESDTRPHPTDDEGTTTPTNTGSTVPSLGTRGSEPAPTPQEPT